MTRRRIRRNPKDAYQKIIDRLQAPAGDPIYKEEHWNKKRNATALAKRGWDDAPDG